MTAAWLMDSYFSWLMPEQEGPAKVLWMRVWQTQQEIEGMNLKDSDNDADNMTNGFKSVIGGDSGKTDKSGNFARARAKQRIQIIDNRPSQRPSHRKFVTDFGGCPWRQERHSYARGIIG